MATKKDARKELLKFIDTKAFDVILKTSPDKYKEKDRENFEEIRRKTENEKEKFHNDYKTAEEVKKNFLQNVHSKPAQKLDKDIERLGLPALPQLKNDFQKLCDELGI